jgi:hypothetical protein
MLGEKIVNLNKAQRNDKFCEGIPAFFKTRMKSIRNHKSNFCALPANLNIDFQD